MIDREKVKAELDEIVEQCRGMDYIGFSTITEHCQNILALLKEQDELLKHEYWRGYNNGRADERGLQEGTIMQTFSPD